MRRALCLTSILLAGAAPVVAQQPDPQCLDPAIVGPALIGGDACQKAIDLFRYFNPQVGTLVQGGNATVGHGGTLRFARFAAGIRLTALRAHVPVLNGPGVSSGPPVSDSYDVDSKWAALPSADVAIGLFEGIPLGLLRVGSIEAIGTGFVVPDVTHGSVRLEPSGARFRFGWGARVGILQESLVTPAIVVTWMRRETPDIELSGRTTAQDSLGVHDLRVRTTGWRVVASKSFLSFGLAGGVGRDEYRSRGDLFYRLRSGLGAATLRVDERVRRLNMFGTVSLNLPLIQFVGEIGRASGGDVDTYNSFATAADAARWYGSAGVRISP
ncbi:MAG TPA: hypothetical protein VJ672_10130 [Gemmatimonadaceae bacterium]|nr:hypothetical protein [Gemmatimonadaceae bacterium]